MKEKEIRDTKALDQYLKLVAHDVKDFFVFRSFRKIGCPACGARQFKHEFVKIGFRYVSCKSCATLFANPRPPYDMLKQFYSVAPSSRFWVEKFFMPVAEARREKIFRPRAEYVKAMMPGRKKIVVGDIGAGFGLFLEEFRKVSPGHEYVAIEPSPEMGDICRKKGFQVREMCLEDMDLSEEGKSFDLLTAFELTEHLYDPVAFIQRVHALLKKDGHFLLTTLNGQGFDIALLWEKSKSVNPPHHLNFFNPASMVYLLEKVGFKVLQVETPGSLDWDIVEKDIKEEKYTADHFWTDFALNGSEQSKAELQHWIAKKQDEFTYADFGQEINIKVVPMKKLNVGIAGYGVVGKRRREFIDKNPHLKVIAVSDRAFKSDGLMPDGVHHFANYKKLLKEKLDVLFVSLPNYLAADVTIEGLRRGMHVFCEKPPGRDVSDIKRVIQVEKKSPGVLLKYGFNHRYHDSVREALRFIQSGKLGSIINIRGVYGKSAIILFSGGWRAQRKYAGGGILLDQGIHMVDLMRLFCGEFVEVKSFISNSYWKHDVEDNAYALMKDAQGRVAILHSSATQWQHRFSLEIACTQGYLELQGILSGSKSYGEEQLIIGRRDEKSTGIAKERVIKYLKDNSWADEINEFADAIVHKKKIQNGNSQDALKTMKLVYDIYYADGVWKKNWFLT